MVIIRHYSSLGHLPAKAWYILKKAKMAGVQISVQIMTNDPNDE